MHLYISMERGQYMLYVPVNIIGIICYRDVKICVHIHGKGDVWAVSSAVQGTSRLQTEMKAVIVTIICLWHSVLSVKEMLRLHYLYGFAACGGWGYKV